MGCLHSIHPQRGVFLFPTFFWGRCPNSWKSLWSKFPRASFWLSHMLISSHFQLAILPCLCGGPVALKNCLLNCVPPLCSQAVGVSLLWSHSPVPPSSGQHFMLHFSLQVLLGDYSEGLTWAWQAACLLCQLVTDYLFCTSAPLQGLRFLWSDQLHSLSFTKPRWRRWN